MEHLNKKDLVIGDKYKHGPFCMYRELPSLMLVFIGNDLVVTRDCNGKEWIYRMKFFLEFASKSEV